MFLQGQYHLRQGQNTASYDRIEEELKGSLEYFQQAVQLNPDWALAHAGLTEAYHWLASGGRPEFQRFWEKSKIEARKALALDETVALADVSLGYVLHRYDWDWVGAERELRRALELDPNLFQWFYAPFLLSAGRYEDAISLN